MIDAVSNLSLFTFAWIVGAITAMIFVALFTENDSPGKAALLALVTAILFEVFSPFKPISFIFNDPLRVLGYLIAYLAIGTVYGVVKWWRYVTTARDRFDRVIAKVLKKRGKALDELDEYDRRTILGDARTAAVGRGNSLPPQIVEHKAQFTGWMAFWPVSGAWTMLNDPVRKLFTAIYESLGGTLQRISDRAFEGVPNEARKD
jgi:hypothetical protein